MSVTHVPIENDVQWHALRAHVIGASEAAALVGVHEYLTYYGLWARKSGRLPAEDDNGAMERGRLLEPVAVEVIRKRYPDINVMVPREHYADHEFCIGATPDLLAHDARGDGVIQIKSVAPRIFRTTWRGESDAVQPPTWIVIQALIEAHLTGAKWAAVAAMVVDHEIDLHLIEIPLHKGIVEQIKTEALKFWELVLSGREPDPDFKRDSEIVRALARQDDGTEIDLSSDNELPGLLAMRETMSAEQKRCEDEVKTINAQLLHRLGSAAIGRFNGGYISAKTIKRASYEVKATQYRQLRVVRDKGEAHG
jgi:predicted phage-related endonuclease